MVKAGDRSEPSQAIMRTIAITNHKGGTGKTTTTVNLAAALGALGWHVLVIDLDPQASATSWLGGSTEGTGLLDALTADDPGPLALLARPTPTANVDLVPASPQLVRAERHLGETVGGERVLDLMIQALPSAKWDYLLLDCPPALGQLTINALAAAQEILVPVEASTMAMAGLASLITTVGRVQRLLNSHLRYCGILACRVDARTVLARDILATLQDKFAGTMLVSVIRETVRLREAFGRSLPIASYAPSSTATVDYRSLALEVAAQEKLSHAPVPA
jgi:chromosome partitioning protein